MVIDDIITSHSIRCKKNHTKYLLAIMYIIPTYSTAAVVTVAVGLVPREDRVPRRRIRLSLILQHNIYTPRVNPRPQRVIICRDQDKNRTTNDIMCPLTRRSSITNPSSDNEFLYIPMYRYLYTMV